MLLLLTGLNRTFCVEGIGCVGHEFTPGDELVGTFVSLTGSSGLPVMRSRTNVMPYLFTYATACFWTLTTFLPCFTLKVPLKRTPLFGRSESQRSWCAVW